MTNPKLLSEPKTNFGVFSAEGAENTKIGFLKARRRRAFKKVFIMKIADIAILFYL